MDKRESYLSAASDSALEARLDESTLTHLAIVLSYFFGKAALRQFKTKLAISVAFVAAFAAFTLLDVFTGSWVTEHLAIRSRTPSGLTGIVFAPFLHPSPSATFIDCAPFLLLSLLAMFRPKGIQTFAVLVVTNAILGGMVVWLLGRSDTNHTGCGAMIFTLFGYLLLVGAVRRDVRSAIISIAVFVMYGGLLWALLPIRDRTLSWEGHLMGMTIGCVLGVYDGRADPNADDDATGGSKTVKSSEVSERTGLTAKEEDDYA